MTRLIQATIFSLLAAILLMFMADMELVKLLPPQAPDSVHGLPVGDFADLWTAGLLARTGGLAVLYDPSTYTAWKEHLFGHPITSDPWIYPPFALPLGALLSLLPVAAAFCLWNAGTLAVMVLLLRRAGLAWGLVALTLICPAELLSLIYGQYGGMIGALSFAALMRAGAAPSEAGVFLGLCAVKPQTVLMVPVAWIAAGRWQTFVAAVCIVAVLASLPLEFGFNSWIWFVTRASHAAAALVAAPFGQGYQLAGTSVFWMLRSFHAGVGVSYAAQAVCALAATGLTYRLWRSAWALPDKASLTLLLSLFVMPYGFAADMVGFSIALTVLASRRPRGINLLDGLFWLWPGYVTLITYTTGHLFTPLVVAAVTARAWAECAPRAEVPAPPL